MKTPPTNTKVRPFLNWAGGKSRQAKRLAALAPPRFGQYIEPFLGAGSLFFALQPRAAILADLNEELIACFRAVRDHPEEVAGALARLKHDRETFERFRQADSNPMGGSEQAVRFIYLNKASFNAVYRVNRDGRYNVPFGRRSAPLARRENIVKAARLLRQAILVSADFEIVVARAKRGDFVYLDPPYYSLNGEGFAKYTRWTFNSSDHERVSRAFRELDRRGCFVMLTNSKIQFITDTYADYSQSPIRANRWVNSDRNGRRALEDVVITNYPPTSS